MITLCKQLFIWVSYYRPWCQAGDSTQSSILMAELRYPTPKSARLSLWQLGTLKFTLDNSLF